MDLNELKTDPKKSEQGTWVRLDDTTRIKIARFGSERFQEAFRARMAPTKKVKGRKLSDQENNEITVDIILDSILLDWEGMQLNGEEVPFSEAREILLNKKYKDFRLMLAEVADDIENFREEELEADSGN